MEKDSAFKEDNSFLPKKFSSIELASTGMVPKGTQKCGLERTGRKLKMLRGNFPQLKSHKVG